MTRRLVIPAVVLALLATLLVWLVSGPSETSGSENVLTPSAAQEDASPTPSPSPSPSGRAGLAELRVTTYEVFLSRDPFEPVVPVSDNSGGGGTPTPGVTIDPTSGPTPTTTPTTGPTPTPTDGTLPPTNGSDSQCMQDGEAVRCEGHVVEPIDVFTDEQGPGAVVRIDDVLYEVRDGDLFAEHFLVQAIDPPSVTLQYGEDVFTLFEGESVLK